MPLVINHRISNSLSAGLFAFGIATVVLQLMAFNFISVNESVMLDYKPVPGASGTGMPGHSGDSSNVTVFRPFNLTARSLATGPAATTATPTTPTTPSATAVVGILLAAIPDHLVQYPQRLALACGVASFVASALGFAVPFSRWSGQSFMRRYLYTTFYIAHTLLLLVTGFIAFWTTLRSAHFDPTAMLSQTGGGSFGPGNRYDPNRLRVSHSSSNNSNSSSSSSNNNNDFFTLEAWACDLLADQGLELWALFREPCVMEQAKRWLVVPYLVLAAGVAVVGVVLSTAAVGGPVVVDDDQDKDEEANREWPMY